MDSIPSSDCSYLALGPLTNLAYFLKQDFKPKNITMTLGRISTNGFLPPFWPIEFNATQDIEAFYEVLKTDIPILVIPLDVAFKLKIKNVHFEQLKKSEIGRYLSKYSQRWRWRSLFLKGRKSFPVWDLLSAMASVHSDVCKIEEGTGYIYKNGLFLCDVLNQPASSHDRKKAVIARKIKIITDFDQDKLWDYFFKTIES